jgi:hypothetical protein
MACLYSYDNINQEVPRQISTITATIKDIVEIYANENTYYSVITSDGITDVGLIAYSRIQYHANEWYKIVYAHHTEDDMAEIISIHVNTIDGNRQLPIHVKFSIQSITNIEPFIGAFIPFNCLAIIDKDRSYISQESNIIISLIVYWDDHHTYAYIDFKFSPAHMIHRFNRSYTYDYYERREMNHLQFLFKCIQERMYIVLTNVLVSTDRNNHTLVPADIESCFIYTANDLNFVNIIDEQPLFLNISDTDRSRIVVQQQQPIEESMSNIRRTYSNTYSTIQWQSPDSNILICTSCDTIDEITNHVISADLLKTFICTNNHQPITVIFEVFSDKKYLITMKTNDINKNIFIKTPFD